MTVEQALTVEGVAEALSYDKNVDYIHVSASKLRGDNCLQYNVHAMSTNKQNAFGYGKSLTAAIKEATCPECGGFLWKSSPECAGHCTQCNQRGI